MNHLIPLSKHCYRLSCLLASLSGDEIKYEPENEVASWELASDWLKIASGVIKVEVDTTKHDFSLSYCGNAWDYEEKRSQLLSELATKLTTFNFIWGAIETVIKVISPKGFDYSLGKKLKRKGDFVDRGVYYLRTQYNQTPILEDYSQTLAEFRLMIEKSNFKNLQNCFHLDEMTSISGLAFHIIRMIRNSFAHGSTLFPDPEDWGEKNNNLSEEEKVHTEIIELSSRLLLFTIQMLILAYYKDQNLSVFVYGLDFGISDEIELLPFARILHLNHDPLNTENTLPLFGD